MNLSPFFSSVGPVQTFTFQRPAPVYPQIPLRRPNNFRGGRRR